MGLYRINGSFPMASAVNNYHIYLYIPLRQIQYNSIILTFFYILKLTFDGYFQSQISSILIHHPR